MSLHQPGEPTAHALHRPSTNTGCLSAMLRSSSSLASGPTLRRRRRPRLSSVSGRRAAPGLSLVVELDRGEALAARPEPQTALAADAQVAHPLRLTARRDQIALAVEREEVHRRPTPGSPEVRPWTSSTREPHTLIPSRVEPRDSAVEDVLRKPTRALEVLILGACIGTPTLLAPRGEKGLVAANVAQRARVFLAAGIRALGGSTRVG